MGLTTSKTVYRQGFGPLIPGVLTAPYPNCLHCKARQAAGGLGYQVGPGAAFSCSWDCLDSSLRSCCREAWLLGREAWVPG